MLKNKQSTLNHKICNTQKAHTDEEQLTKPAYILFGSLFVSHENVLQERTK